MIGVGVRGRGGGGGRRREGEARESWAGGIGLGVASLKRARGLLAVLKIAIPLSSSIVLFPLCLYRHSIDVQLYGVT